MPDNTNTAKSLNELKRNVNFNLILDSRRLFGHIYKTDESILKNWHNVEVSNIQSFSSKRLFKLFAANDSSFSSSLYTHVRMMTDDFRVTAYKNNDSTFAEGQAFIDRLRAKFDYTETYGENFYTPNTITDQISKISRNILTSDNAASALFVKLNEDYTVEEFCPIDCDSVYFKTNLTTRKIEPYTYVDGRETSLNYLNFIWQPIDCDAGEITGNNPLRPGLRTTFTKIEFLENLRKVLKNQAWPKVKVVLDEQATINLAPPEVKQDPKKLIAWVNDYLSKVEAQLTGIEPDQNIIVYDTIKEISFLESSKNFDPTPIAKLIDSELISSFKAPPSTIGKGGSTRTGEGLASAELVIFRRSIKALRKAPEITYSRAFTLAMRLAGLQGYAKFRLKEFTLRPPEESAQFDTMRQDAIITAWEKGAINDEEKNRRVRQIHNFDGPAPPDAKIRETVTVSPDDNKNKKTERDADAERRKEERRSDTRKRQKTGSDRK